MPPFLHGTGQCAGVDMDLALQVTHRGGYKPYALLRSNTENANTEYSPEKQRKCLEEEVMFSMV